MDTTRAEFIVKMRRLVAGAENGAYASECFQDCEICVSPYGGTLEFKMGPARVELRLYRATLGEVKEEAMQKEDGPQKIRFDRITENLIEIVTAYELYVSAHPDMVDIDSLEWKQNFVNWANEFEEKNSGREWTAERGNDYYEEIEHYALQKIREVAGNEEIKTAGE